MAWDNVIFDRLPRIFRDCTTKDANRKYCLEYPQRIGDHVYATDGRIAVRMPLTPWVASAIPDIAPKRFPESAAAIIGAPRDRWHVEPTPIPSLDHLTRCEDCKGDGHLPEHRCSCKYVDDPEEASCHGKGIIPAGPCWECDGTGIATPGWVFVPLREDVSLSALYLSLLGRHGATLFLPVEINTNDSVTPPYFTLGDIEGVVMPKLVPKPDAGSSAEGSSRPRSEAPA